MVAEGSPTPATCFANLSLSEAMATGTRRPHSAIDGAIVAAATAPDVPSPLSRDPGPHGAQQRMHGDPFPLLGATPDERIGELKQYMVTMNDKYSSLIARIENKADRTFACQSGGCEMFF